MVLFNYAIREITAKIVYYGPGLCGKTTNLEFIHEKLDASARGRLLSLATDGDRTLFFDFLPIEMGSIGGYKVRFQLYTVPGQVHYNATRKLVLKGVDAVVFVADSQLSMLERNRESYENLVANLVENGYDPAKIPVVFQLNKRDLPNIASVGELMAAIGVAGSPLVEAVACRGDGVFETLKEVVKLTLARLRNQFDVGASAPEEPLPVPPPPPPPSAAFAPAPTEAAPAPPVPPPVGAPPPPAVPPAAVEPPSIEWPSAPETEGGGAVPPDGEAVAEVEQAEEYEEFDLEELSGGDFGDLGKGLEIGLEGGSEPPVETPGGEGAQPPDLGPGFTEEGLGPGLPEEDWLSVPASEGMFAPVSETRADEPPGWALELREDLMNLRGELRDLREALRRLAAIAGRQSEVLREGREELERLFAAEAGKEGP